MKATRRGFFGLIASLSAMPAAALAAINLPGQTCGFSRLSVEKGDPGEIPLATLRAEGFRPIIFLDGVEEKRVITADSSEGWIKRVMTSPSGKMLLNGTGDDILTEIVSGAVVIRAVQSAQFQPIVTGEFGREVHLDVPANANVGRVPDMSGRLRSFRKSPPGTA